MKLETKSFLLENSLHFDIYLRYFLINSEAGPLCVSPTGQFIAPSTCPGAILVDFLSTHMNEAAEKAEAYKK